MKKLISVLMISALTLSLAACGSSKKATEATTEEEWSDIVEVKIDHPEQYAKLGKYKGLVIDSAKVEITDKQVDEELEDVCYQYSEYKKVTDRNVVEEEDIVNIDFDCTTDKGEVVEEYTQADFDVTIGSDEMVYGDDLDVEDAMTGKKVGDKVKVTGSFYDDDTYGDLAGQKVTFVVTINYIEEEVLPELTDEFVKENFDYDTLEEYRKAIKEELQEQASADVDSDNKAALWDLVVKNSEQLKEFPEEMLEQEKENTITYEKEWADYFGMSIGETDEEIEQYFQETYEMSVTEYANDSLFRQCLLQLIVEAEGINPTDKEIDAAIKEEMEAGGYASEEEVLEYTSRENIREEMIHDRVMDILVKNATIKDKK